MGWDGMGWDDTAEYFSFVRAYVGVDGYTEDVEDL